MGWGGGLYKFRPNRPVTIVARWPRIQKNYFYPFPGDITISLLLIIGIYYENSLGSLGI